FRSPMALAVIGGLIFSTVLSLVFVPAMVMVMDDIGALIWRFGKRLIVSQADHELTPVDHQEDQSKRPGGPPNMISPAAE
ncbi:efflux RND transporter permease subunit, partial [Pseudomonas aeruginosa]|nr:efflux RND transporter permease subunit [Pseudomonas aeruginosa]